MTSPVAGTIHTAMPSQILIVQQVLVKIHSIGKCMPHGDSQAVVYTEDSSIDM